MPKVIVGKPESEEPQDDKDVGWWVHDNLYCTMDIKPDGVYIDGWGKDGQHIFNKQFPNAEHALGFIEAKRKFFGEGEDNEK
jgi:hypothetical protein